MVQAIEGKPVDLSIESSVGLGIKVLGCVVLCVEACAWTIADSQNIMALCVSYGG